MKQSIFLRTKEFFHGNDSVRNFSFKVANTRDSYALLAKANHQLAMSFAISRGKSVHFHDCFECLSPHEKAA